jgi:huntingtin-interacting protein 1-related protein
MASAWSSEAHHFSGYGQLIQEYIYYLLAKLAFHRQHQEFNGKGKEDSR